MGTTYTACSEDINDLVKDVMKKHHADLFKENVTIDAVGARKDSKREGSVPALMLRGQRVLAKIGITSLQDRARGIADAKLTIDMFSWDTMPQAKKVAVIDHELTYLNLVMMRATKKEPWRKGPKHDDLNRPVLKLRHHDWELTGFQEVVERHGEASVEASQFLAFKAEFGQLSLFDTTITDGPGKKGGKKK